MKQWRIWSILALLLCLPIFLNRSSGQSLLAETDTAVLLQAIRARHAPLSWLPTFPLANPLEQVTVSFLLGYFIGSVKDDDSTIIGICMGLTGSRY